MILLLYFFNYSKDNYNLSPKSLKLFTKKIIEQKI